MKTYVTRFNRFSPGYKARSIVCGEYDDCLVVEFTMRELMDKNSIVSRLVDEWFRHDLLVFYNALKKYTPDHVNPDRDTVYVVTRIYIKDFDGSVYTDELYSVTLFLYIAHYEHSDIDELLTIYSIANYLFPGWMYPSILEHMDYEEYIVFRFYLGTVFNRELIDEERRNHYRCPVERLVWYALSDNILEHAFNILIDSNDARQRKTTTNRKAIEIVRRASQND